MNRRIFVSSFATALLASALPLSWTLGREARSESAHAGSNPWQDVSACAADCGRVYAGSGPVAGDFELVEARSWQPGQKHQFLARFRAPESAAEGIYELRNGQTVMSLFLQPVPGRRGLMEAPFSLLG